MGMPASPPVSLTRCRALTAPNGGRADTTDHSISPTATPRRLGGSGQLLATCVCGHDNVTPLEAVEADDRAGYQHERKLPAPSPGPTPTCRRRQQPNHDSDRSTAANDADPAWPMH